LRVGHEIQHKNGRQHKHIKQLDETQNETKNTTILVTHTNYENIKSQITNASKAIEVSGTRIRIQDITFFQNAEMN
jgi:hypothetical protein